MENEYSTGAFAQMCKISKKTLFHYDRIGLLKPTRIDENGYRVYASHQADVVSTIKLFQEIGLSLKAIAEVFQLQDLTVKSQVLRAQKRTVTERIKELQKISDGIDFMAERFEQFQKIGVNQLFEEILTKEEYYRAIPRYIGQGVSVNYLNYGYQCGVIFDRETLLKKKEHPRYDQLFYKVSSKESNFTKSKGKYLSTFYLLKNEEIMDTVPQFIQEVDLAKTTGPLFHEDFCNEIAGIPDKFIIKLSIQVD